MPKTVFNPGDSPIVIDGRGHIVGGGEWASVEDSRIVNDHVEAGRLVFVEAAVGEDTNPVAAEALRASAGAPDKAPAEPEAETAVVEAPKKGNR